MIFHYICEALIDQNRYIGSDPVGYGCTQQAAFELGTGHKLCRECAELIQQRPERIELPPIYEPQEMIVRRLIDRLTLKGARSSI